MQHVNAAKCNGKEPTYSTSYMCHSTTMPEHRLDLSIKSCSHYGGDESADTQFVTRLARSSLGLGDSDVPDSSIKCEVMDHARLQSSYGNLAAGHQSRQSEYRMTNGRMARSCAPDWSPSRVTHFNRFTCNYMGVGMTDHGPAYMPFREYKGTLASCDDGYLEISDELMRDIQLSAYHAADGESANLDPALFSCKVSSFPTH